MSSVGLLKSYLCMVSIKLGLHISRKDRSHMFPKIFFKLSRCGLVSISLERSQVFLFYGKYSIDMPRALKSSLEHSHKYVLRSLHLYGEQALTLPDLRESSLPSPPKVSLDNF